MAILNPFEKSNLTILTEIVEYKERAAKANPVVMGTERIDKRTGLARIQKMSPEERVAMLDKMGSKMLEML